MNIVAGLTLLSLVFSLGEDDNIGFLYGVLGRFSFQDDTTMILEDSSIINTGDEVRINAGYLQGTYFYVIYKGSSGEFDLLYPSKNKLVSNIDELQDTIYTTVLPWIPFSVPIGDETFFLINSNSKQGKLMDLFRRYDKTNEKNRIKIAKKIQKELENLNPETIVDLANISSRLNKPVLGGVTYRADGKDKLSDISLTHTCLGNSDIAFKKIILNHQ